MKVKKIHEGAGFFDDVGKVLKPVGKEVGKEALNLLGDLAKQKAKEKIESTGKPKAQAGKGIYSAGVSLSPAQARSVRSGRGITVKPAMIEDGARFLMKFGPEMAKKIAAALKKNKGFKLTRDMVEDITDMKTGGSAFGAFARVIGPIIAEKLIDVGIGAAQKKLEGSGFLDNFVSQVSKYRPSDIKKIKPGKALKDLQSGKLHSEIFKITNPIMREQSGAPSIAQVKEGDGIFAAGSGMMKPIQTGSPYMSSNSPAARPFVASNLLTTSKAPTGSARKGAGKFM